VAHAVQLRARMKQPINPFEFIIEPIPAGHDPMTALASSMHDCPECRAALARGETPIIMTGAELVASLPRPLRRRIEREQAKAERRAARRG
jgi:hypothetical protein